MFVFFFLRIYYNEFKYGWFFFWFFFIEYFFYCEVSVVSNLCMNWIKYEFVYSFMFFGIYNYNYFFFLKYCNVKFKFILFILGWMLLLILGSEDIYFSFWFKINKVKYMIIDNIWYFVIGIFVVEL